MLDYCSPTMIDDAVESTHKEELLWIVDEQGIGFGHFVVVSVLVVISTGGMVWGKFRRNNVTQIS